MGSTDTLIDVPALLAVVAGKGIKHYGIKGMKWGVRKKDGGSSGPQPVTTTQRKPGAKLETKGGGGHDASTEAVRVASIRQKGKKSGTVSLTNAELQEAVTRMNLEQQYGRLSQNQKSAGQKFVEGLLLNAGKQQAQTIVNQEVGRQVGAYMGKRATRG